MALTSLGRWELLREIILKRKTGRIVLQIGSQYVHWSIASGKVLFVSSTLPEDSFSQFLSGSSWIEKAPLTSARSQVNERQSLGSVLIRNGILSASQFEAAYFDYCLFLTTHLLRSTNNLLWSACPPPLKAEFASVDLPLWRLLLASERQSLEIRTVVEFAQRFPHRYVLGGHNLLADLIRHPETIILEYLQRGASLNEILANPDLDRLTCYRLPFLLWLGGFLQPRTAADLTSSTAVSPEKKSGLAIQPAWIIALVIGMILGLLLAPESPRPVETVTGKSESMREMLEKPAWKTGDNLKEERPR